MSSTTTRTIHGIDLYAPDGLAQLFAFRRAQFGDAVMQDDSAGTTTDAAGTTADGVTPPATGDPVTPPADPATPPAASEPVTPPASADGAAVTPPATTTATPVNKGDEDDSDDESDDDDDADEVVDGQDVKSLPDWAQKLVEKARTRGAKYRTGKIAAENAQKELLGTLGKQLGLDAEADGVKVLDAVKALAEENTTIKTDAALSDAIAALGVSPTTRAVAIGEGRLKGLLTSDPEFAAKVKTAVEETVAANPILKATAHAAGGSSVDPGGTQSPNTVTKAAFDAMSASQLMELKRKNPSLYSQLDNS